jgi:plastocyanin
MMSLRIAAAVLILSAPLAGLAYAQSSASGADWSKAETVEIDLDSYSFTPKALHLKRGMAYTLHFVNKSSKGHNFNSPGFFGALTVATEDQSKIDSGKVEVDGGQSVDIKAVANTPGTYKVECSHFLHASFGMTGEAVIE